MEKTEALVKDFLFIYFEILKLSETNLSDSGN